MASKRLFLSHLRRATTQLGHTFSATHPRTFIALWVPNTTLVPPCRVRASPEVLKFLPPWERMAVKSQFHCSIANIASVTFSDAAAAPASGEYYVGALADTQWLLDLLNSLRAQLAKGEPYVLSTNCSSIVPRRISHDRTGMEHLPSRNDP